MLRSCFHRPRKQSRKTHLRQFLQNGIWCGYFVAIIGSTWQLQALCGVLCGAYWKLGWNFVKFKILPHRSCNCNTESIIHCRNLMSYKLTHANFLSAASGGGGGGGLTPNFGRYVPRQSEKWGALGASSGAWKWGSPELTLGRVWLALWPAAKRSGWLQ